MTAQSQPALTHTIREFVLLGRPLHLLGGFLFHTLGITIAILNGASLNWSMAIAGQLVVWSFQLMTHYSNEYFDFAADTANTTPTDWSGGSRVLVRGAIAPPVALYTALLMALLGVVGTIILMTQSTAPLQTGLLLVLALTLAWSYSSPPLLLNQRALGEVTGALLVPGITTLVGFQLQAGSLGLQPLLAIIPLCCFQFTMLLAVNFPDAASDASVGKITLVVLITERRAAALFVSVLLLAYLLLPFLVVLGLPWLVAALLLLTSPIAGWLGWCVWHGGWNERQYWNDLGFWSIGLLMSAGLMELLGFGLLVWPLLV